MKSLVQFGLDETNEILSKQNSSSDMQNKPEILREKKHFENQEIKCEKEHYALTKKKLLIGI